jgi:hypothetical protein
MKVSRRSWWWLLVVALGTTFSLVIGLRAPRMEPTHGRPVVETPPPEVPPAGVVPPEGAERTAQELPPDAPAQDAAAAASDPFVRWLRDPEQGLLVEGIVTVLDAEDREHGEEDGEFMPLALLEGNGGGGRKVAVHAGRFRMHFPRGRELGIASLVLGGRRAFLPEDPKKPPSTSIGDEGTQIRFAVVEGQPIHVLARWARPFRLHVVDARDGQELDDVTVVLARGDWHTKNARHPGALASAETLVEHGKSPLELAGPRASSNLQWQDVVWAHAAGRTWGRVRVDFEQGGEATLGLEAGADLEVTLVGAIPPAPATQKLPGEDDDSRAVLRLRPRDLASLALEAPPASRGPTRFEGLAPGSFDLSLERGKSWDRPQQLGRTPVELVAGATTHAEIVVTPPQEPRRVRVAGTLHLSHEWKCVWLDLRFEPFAVPGGTSLEARALGLTDLAAIAGSPDLFRFELTPILPGRYLVRCYAFAFQQMIETGDAGRDDLALSIGDPADVLVHALDAANDLPVRDDGLLLWTCRWPGESRSGGLAATKWDEARQAWRFRAPAGEVELWVAFGSRVWELAEASPYITVRPGDNEFTLRVRRAFGFFVHFEVDGRKIDCPRDATKIRIEPEEGEPIAIEVRTFQDDGFFVRAPSAGRWRVVVPPLAGYEPVDPVEVTLQAGVIERLAIPLRRRE